MWVKKLGSRYVGKFFKLPSEIVVIEQKSCVYRHSDIIFYVFSAPAEI
ncbi:MAG: hypothetical protein ACJAXW_004408 [Candidatus Azotimanducaceae bacterium]|jgi:hypothetical protein